VLVGGKIVIPWMPQEKQAQFLDVAGVLPLFQGKPAEVRPPASRCIGYGGSAGGGKTDTLLLVGVALGLLWPGCRIAFFRRKFTELEGLGGAIDRSRELMTGWARYHGNLRQWTLPGGSRIQFCHCHREGDVYDYQSKQFDVLLVDEATHFTEFQIQYLMTRNRATVDGAVPLACFGTNPGNVGHLWFKSWFVEAGEPGKVLDVQVEGKTRSHVFIPARLDDNLILEARDPDYRSVLESQPEELRRALLHGDWDVFAGQVFQSWRKETHVIPSFEPPAHWWRWRGLDWGYRAPFCCLWLARDPDSRRVVVYREAYYTRLTDGEQADLVRELSGSSIVEVEEPEPEDEDPPTPPRIGAYMIDLPPIPEIPPEDGEDIRATLADPSMWTVKTFEKETTTSADIYARHGVELRKADNRRLIGLRRVMEALEPMEDGRPGLLVTEDCPNLIRTLPALPYNQDSGHPEDVDDSAEDHGYDALRYGIAWDHGGPREEPEKGEDPWAKKKAA
jgi:hypothetical protein